MFVSFCFSFYPKCLSLFFVSCRIVSCRVCRCFCSCPSSRVQCCAALWRHSGGATPEAAAQCSDEKTSR
jgi:hypothetical protein